MGDSADGCAAGSLAAGVTGEGALVGSFALAGEVVARVTEVLDAVPPKTEQPAITRALTKTIQRRLHMLLFIDTSTIHTPARFGWFHFLSGFLERGWGGSRPGRMLSGADAFWGGCHPPQQVARGGRLAGGWHPSIQSHRCLGKGVRRTPCLAGKERAVYPKKHLHSFHLGLCSREIDRMRMEIYGIKYPLRSALAKANAGKMGSSS